MKHTVDSSCIFCKIVAGTIPSFKVFENEAVLAFMDINALSRGHTLVIPKHHAVRTHELPTDVMSEVGKALSVVAKAVVAATGNEDYNILQNNGAIANQAVNHVHFHIIPKTATEGLGLVWKAGEPDKGELAKLASDIQSKI